MNRKRLRKGISLIEVIVVSVLVFMMFYYIYKMLAPGMRAWRRSDVKVSIQQNNLVAMYRLMNDLKESNIHTISLRNCDVKSDRISTLICLASARDEKGVLHTKIKNYGAGKNYDSKEPDWQNFVIYYLDEKMRLRRRVAGNYIACREPRGMSFKGNPVNAISVDNTTTDQVIARKIEALTILYNPDEEHWSGGFDVKIVAAYLDPDPAETFRTALQSTLEVRYDEPDEN